MIERLGASSCRQVLFCGLVAAGLLGGCGGRDALPAGESAPPRVALPALGLPLGLTVDAGVDFGTVQTGTTAYRRIAIHNNNLLVTYTLAAPYFAPVDGLTLDLAPPQVLSPGAQATFEVAFAPTSPGALSASALLGYSDGTSAGSLSTALTGTAVAPPSAALSFAPAAGVVGSTVTLQLQAFDSADAVLFNGLPAPFATVLPGGQVATVLVPPGAASGPLTLRTAAGVERVGAFTVSPSPPPRIARLAPVTGPPATLVTLTGVGFTGASDVRFDNTSTQFTIASDTSITTYAPAAATRCVQGGCTITVVTAGGTAQSAGLFRESAAPPPTFASFTPTMGPPGTRVVATATGVDAGVKFSVNGTPQTSLGGSAFQIAPGTASGPVSFTDFHGAATAPGVFTVLPLPAPTVTSLSPAKGAAGSQVTVQGTNFVGVSAVTLGGAAATFTVTSPTALVVTVPPAASTGPVTVTTSAGTARSAGAFGVPPTLSGLAPAFGPAGTVVHLTGRSFSGATGVSFGARAAVRYTVLSDGAIDAVAPATPGTTTVTVTTPSGAVASAATFSVVLAPRITSFTPARGAPGSSITLTGSSFQGASDVRVGGVPAAFSIADGSTVNVTIPVGALGGRVTLVTPSGTATSAATFSVIPPTAPSITFSWPTGGVPGRLVSIQGVGLDQVSSVLYAVQQTGGLPVSVHAQGPGWIVVEVPSFYANGPVPSGTFTVTTAGGSVTSGLFTVTGTGLWALGVSPRAGTVGTVVTVGGFGFSDPSSVSVTFSGEGQNGVPATPTDVTFGPGNLVGIVLLQVVIPPGAASGPLVITDRLTGQSVTTHDPVFVIAPATCQGVVCTALDSCHSAGICDPLTGGCTNPVKPDGAACDDGSACTRTDTCQAGVCAGRNPVVCAASDQCHAAGTCDPGSGACSNPTVTDGTACVGSDKCFQSSTCQAGVCAGSNPVVCVASDQCHAAGTCDPGSGACSNPPLTDGTACVGTNKCFQRNTCQAGLCAGSNPVVCAASDQCHAVGTCDPSSGACSSPPVANGTACVGSNKCFQTTTCQAGVCAGSNPVVCAASDQCHAVGTCDPTSGACSNPTVANGTACAGSNKCLQTNTCQAGVCAGSNPVVCAASDQCHAVGTCDPTSGACSNPTVANGTACTGSNKCFQSSTCQAGVCAGSNPVVCAASDQCHAAGTCDPTSGACTNPTVANGTACVGSNKCLQTNTCQAGVCAGSNPVVCAASDQCHAAGTCDPTSGACTNPTVANGTACVGSNKCLQTNTCQAGVCAGSNPVVCAASDQCHAAGTCDPTSGVCSNPPVSNGTACANNNKCFQDATCQVGVCTGRGPVVCSALDACHSVGTCDPASGACSNPLKVDGSSCGNGNSCVGGVCQNSPIAQIAPGGHHTCLRHQSGLVTCVGDNTAGQLGRSDSLDARSLTPATVTGITDAVALASGEWGSCAVRQDGSVWCWGLADHGALGDGRSSGRAVAPVQVQNLPPASLVSVGNGHACAVTQANQVYCWGRNDTGQVGDGSLIDRTGAVLVGAGVEVSANDGFSCLRTQAGGVSCFGANDAGQLGLGAAGAPLATPQPVALVGIVALATGGTGGHMCAVASPNGLLYCWGRNDYGQADAAASYSNRPSPYGLGGSGWSTVSLGADSTCGRFTNGIVYCWGRDNWGQLGIGIGGDVGYGFVTAAGSTLAVSVGGRHACIVDAQGGAECFGKNHRGQLGDGSDVTRGTATLVPFPNGCAADLDNDASNCGQCGLACAVGIACQHGMCQDESVAQIAPGGNHTCTRHLSGKVACVGDNLTGQLGAGARLSGASAIPGLVPGLTDAVEIESGHYGTCALRHDHTVVCWGQGQHGALGNGGTTLSLSPVVVSGVANAVRIAVGEEHACALAADGTLGCWGRNDSGQLGDGTTNDHSTLVAAPALGQIADVVAGVGFTCAVRVSGEVYCWGANDAGQLGDGNGGHPNDHSLVAVRPAVAEVSAMGSASTAHHICAISAGAQYLYCWGRNDYGQADAAASYSPRLAPTLLGGSGWVEVASGGEESCARQGNFTSCWGHDGWGQLGIGVGGEVGYTFVTPFGPAGAIGVGGVHACVVDSAGAAWCFGKNHRGQLGDGSTATRGTATAMTFPGGCAADVTRDATNCGQCGHACANGIACVKGLCQDPATAQIAPGAYHTCSRHVSGAVTCWGDNLRGQLGSGDAAHGRGLQPVPVTGISDAIGLASGRLGSCAVRSDSSVACWGTDDDGELGDGLAPGPRGLTPATVPGLAAVKVALGTTHACALGADGTVQCWGANDAGQIGDGTTTARPSPTPVAGLDLVIDISAGDRFSCALRVDGDVRCWGDDGDGAVGDGLGAPGVIRTTPVTPAIAQVSVLGPASTARHICAIANGAQYLYCWGRNDYGQADAAASYSTRLAPYPIGGSGWAEVASGGEESCARQGNFTSCWGHDGWGQLGIGVGGEVGYTFVTPFGPAGAIGVGGAHACVVDGSGAPWCFGRNHRGQLGEGSTATRGTPTPVVYPAGCGADTLNNPANCGACGHACANGAGCSGGLCHPDVATAQTAAGAIHTCARLRSGDVACWGDNASGQIGTGCATPTCSTEVTVVGATDAIDLAAGGATGCIVRSDGRVSCWGDNTSGQLGFAGASSATLVDVGGVARATKVAVGTGHACALDSQGRAFCWGRDDLGQLGQGVVGAPLGASPVAGIDLATDVSTGDGFTCVLRVDGTVRCFGRNDEGELGDGNGGGAGAHSATPVVAGIDQVSSLGSAAAAHHVCAIRNGVAYLDCWGSNSFAQSDAVGVLRNVLSPHELYGGLASVSTGEAFTCAVGMNAITTCWGRDQYGQIGIGGANDAAYPFETVAGLGASALGIALGATHACVVQDGGMSCWGNGTSGQLGDGLSLTVTVPVAVAGIH